MGTRVLLTLCTAILCIAGAPSPASCIVLADSDRCDWTSDTFDDEYESIMSLLQTRHIIKKDTAASISADGETLQVRTQVSADGEISLRESTAKERSPSDDVMMKDMFDFWNSFRDPKNGLYCDAIYFTDSLACGVQNNFYSLATTGMGLVMDSIFSELGLLPRSVAKDRSLKTIRSIARLWPRCSDTAFFAHFTNRRRETLGEFSTIDTAIGALGALFAGHYFEGDVKIAADDFARIPQWTAVIKGTRVPTSAPTGYIPAACLGDITWGRNEGRKQEWYQNSFARKMQRVAGVTLDNGTFEDYQRLYKCLDMNSNTCKGLDFPKSCSNPPCNVCLDSSMYLTAKADGAMTNGILKPFNEYYLTAYLASRRSLANNRTDASALQAAERYFEVFFGSTTGPQGDGDWPVYKTYQGYRLLGDVPGQSLIPSFHVQFAYFLTKGFGKNPFYANLFADSMKADMKSWEIALTDATRQIFGQVWGSGAGAAPLGYKANSPTDNTDLVFSTPIMAGFLRADTMYTDGILNQLRDMYNKNICTYSKTLPSQAKVTVLWRCSVKRKEWRATRVEGIDFSTMILGFSQQYLPIDFFGTYAA